MRKRSDRQKSFDKASGVLKGLADFQLDHPDFKFDVIPGNQMSPRNHNLIVETNIPVIGFMDAGHGLEECVDHLTINVSPDGRMRAIGGFKRVDHAKQPGETSRRTTFTPDQLSVKGRGAPKKVLGYVTQRAKGLAPS